MFAFKDICSFFKGKGISKNDISSNGKIPCIRYGELYTHYKEVINHIISFTNCNIDELIFSKKNDILIPSSGETKNDIATSSCITLNNIAIGSDLHILRTKQNGIFFSYYINHKIRKKISMIAQGDAIVHLYAEQLKNIEAYFPSLPEQQKIADCLSSLDELIEAHEQKLDTLKQHKKGLMQRLFPAEGETMPRWRFPEFRNAGEWEEDEIGNIFNVTRGQVLAMTEVQTKQTETYIYPVYSSQTKNNGLAGFYSKYLYEDAITWTTDGANAGEVNFRKGKFYCTNVCGVLLNNNGYANKCISELINSVSKKYVSYVGNPKLMNNVMEKIKIPIPSLPEQQKIADCLTSIDERIEAQEEKIVALKEHKKGLMQQLFPSL